jgi:hypothetical protein
MIKIKKAKEVKIKGKSKIGKVKKAVIKKEPSAYIPKDFNEIKKFVKLLTRAVFDKIVKACKDEPSQDIRLGRASCSGVTLLNLFFEKKLNKFRGKSVSVLSMTGGVLHTLNASDRKLLLVLGLMSGSDKADVVKFLFRNKDIKHPRKALEVRIKK